jgi:hypothetical protein
MSDAGDLIEVILRFLVKLIVWIGRMLVELFVEVLFHGFLRLGESIAEFLQRCRLPRWLAGLLALLLVLAVIAAPIASLVGILRFFYG